MFTKEGVVGLVPPRQDWGCGGPGVVPTGPVECVRGLGTAGICRGSSHGMGVLSRFVPNAKSHLVTAIEAPLAASHRSPSGPPRPIRSLGSVAITPDPIP